ncbi:MAG: nucleotidyltransferase domain-containing protein [bacterium]|nr:nucleotidyltransferase domain-containing protein [bacterium]
MEKVVFKYPEVSPALLGQITDVIVKETKPQFLVLFGSHARGEANRQSDLDFLVVLDSQFDVTKRFEIMNRLDHLLTPFRIPCDIIVRTRDEFDYWKTSLNNVVGRASREGKVLYERP